MKASAIPTKLVEPFAKNATASFIRSIPQTTSDPNAASLDLGFPPNTFNPLGSGGAPPDGRDFNGILNGVSGWAWWLAAGGPIAYDSTFQTAIGGYPKGAVVASAVTAGVLWRSTIDDNTTNPDTGGANWVRFTASLPQIGFLNLKGTAAGGTKTASWTIDQLTAVTALGGFPYFGSSLSLNFNGATIGANGMDTGTLPASATDVAVYAIYNPATNTWASLGTVESSAAPQVYSGANMPSGYTASVLIWAGVTDSSGNIQAFSQIDRSVYLFKTTIVTGLTSVSWASLPISSAIPRAARAWTPSAIQTSAANPSNIWFAPTNSTAGGPGQTTTWSGTSNSEGVCVPVPITTPQTAFYQISAGQTWTVFTVGYSL